jgi:uncharacterized membrane protein
LKNFFKKNLIAGLLVTLPIGLTVLILSFVINTLDQWMAPWIATIIVRMQLPLPEDFYLPGLGFGLVCLFVFLTGLLATNFFGKRMVQAGEYIMNNIPLVRGFYTTIKKMIDTVSQTSTNSFKELVLVQYPHRSLKMLGLVASETLEEVAARTGEDQINVFLPLLPNVTLGFFIIVPRSQVQTLNMDIESGMKFLMSFGIVDASSDKEGDRERPEDSNRSS